MSKISWLHLSDLHLGKDLYNEKVVLKELIEDIKRQIQINQLDLNFVFITGDLTFSGRQKEFDLAKEFIDELIHAIKLNKEDIILVPGNHDVYQDDLLSRDMGRDMGTGFMSH